MAREATITFEQVAATADKIKVQGGKPSSRNIREVLGCGSMATVLKLLQQWQAGQTRQSLAINDTLDPTIVCAISNQIATRVQEAIAETTARLADLQIEADAIIIENERQAIEIETQAAELFVLQGQHAELAGRAQQLETDAARTAAELVAERRSIEAARVELAKAELRLEAVPKIEAEIEKIQAELFQARTQAAEHHEVAAVATAKFEAEVSQRKGVEAQLVEAVRRGDEAGERAVASTESLGNERLATQACQAKLAAAAREIGAANEAVIQARNEAKQSSEAAAELRGQLTTVKSNRSESDL